MGSKLTLVGAGPGDPELISVKGIKALRNADAVLYDALAHPDLLEYCNQHAAKIFVGKRAGVHSYQQQQINQLIVKHALPEGHVVRLKGGDPFIFGRGQEEISYAQSFGIETVVIPGISSINLPGYYGIPLTVRGINESFWVITATTTEGRLSNDLKLAAQSNATVVVFMGLKKLPKIVELYKNAQRPNLPVAIITKGSLPEGNLLVGRISDIEEIVNREKPSTPALLVLGETVGSHPEFYRDALVLKSQILENHA